MVPGIDPKVDIAFKQLFGTPAWCELTISLINAVLMPESGRQVIELELLDPYSEKDSPTDKLTILDLKARDQQGRLFNVEMQMNLVPSLAQRLLYYWSRLCSHQLAAGEEFVVLRPTVSICFLNQIMLPDRDEYHAIFRLLESTSRTCLTDDLQIHVLEMPKFRRKLEWLQEPLDYWLYLFQNGRELDADALPVQLTRPEICQAMEVLKVFSQSDIERDRYENRLKALRDHRDFIRARDEAVEERDKAVQRLREFEQERQQERQQAKQERQQAEQEIKQALLSRIALCQRLLGHPPMVNSELLSQSAGDLRTMADQLERQLTSE